MQQKYKENLVVPVPNAVIYPDTMMILQENAPPV